MNVPENQLILGLIATTTGVVLYIFGPSIGKITNPLIKSSLLDPDIWSIYDKRLSGLLWLGIIPAVFIGVFGAPSNNFYGLAHKGSSGVSILVITLALVILIVTYFNSQSKNNLKVYPQIRKKVWSAAMLAGSAVTWMLYLLAYEFMFRGILLFSSLEVLSQNTAIALNVMFYSLFHLQKGLKEVLASIPFGLILCLLVIKSGSIWLAFFLHLELALCTEWLSIHFNPDIALKKLI